MLSWAFQLWATDGTLAGTAKVFDTTQASVDVDPTNYLPHFPRMTVYKNSLFFSAGRGRLLETRPRGGLGHGLARGAAYTGQDTPEDAAALAFVSNLYGNDIGLRQYDTTGFVTQAIAVYDLDALPTDQLAFSLSAVKGYARAVR